MRRLLLPIVTAALLASGACSAAAPAGEPTVAPATSAATSRAASPSPSPSGAASPSPSASRTSTSKASKGSGDGSVEEQGDDSGNDMTSFAHAYTYQDGVQVEVTKIRHGRRKGTDWVQLTVRVTNGSKHRLDELVGDVELSYGPHKDPADPVKVAGVGNRGLSGGIARGQSQTSAVTFAVPAKHQDDVVLGFTPDMDHDTAYFSGSIA